MQPSDILVHDDHLEINVKNSKTDQFRQGNIVFIAKSGGATCPHSLLSRYLSAAGIDLNSSAYIFRTLHPHRKDSSYTLGPRRLSNTRCILVQYCRANTTGEWLDTTRTTRTTRTGRETMVCGLYRSWINGDMHINLDSTTRTTRTGRTGRETMVHESYNW